MEYTVNRTRMIFLFNSLKKVKRQPSLPVNIGDSAAIERIGKALLNIIAIPEFDDEDPIFTRDTPFPRKNYDDATNCHICQKLLKTKFHWYFPISD